MFAQLKALLAHRRARHEVLALTARDLDDLDLTRAELLAFIDMPQDAPDRFAAMADLLGVPQVRHRADRRDYRDMLRLCGQCRNRAQCAALLARGAPARAEAIACCSNAMTCLALAEPQPACAA